MLPNWIKIQPLLKNEVIDTLRIAHVASGSPPEVAGLRVGMRVIEVQGIRVSGMSEREFSKRMDLLPAAHQLELKVLSVATDAVRTIVVPITLQSAAAAPPTATVTTPGAGLSAADVNERIAEIRRKIKADVERVRAEAREKGRTATDVYLLQRATEEMGEALPTHLARLCQAAADAEGDDPTNGLYHALVGAINGSHEYRPEHRAILVRYAAKVPDLVLTLERMQWLEDTESVVAEGWKKVKASNGRPAEGSAEILNARVSRYAIIAARQGVVDALVSLARPVRAPNSARRAKGITIAQEAAALRALVPGIGEHLTALTDYAIKNKSRLQFDARNRVYVLAP